MLSNLLMWFQNKTWPHNMQNWVWNNTWCYKFHEIKFMLFLRYHDINHISSVYDSAIKAIPDVLECTSILCMPVFEIVLRLLQYIYGFARWDGFWNEPKFGSK